jgi:micrococcal nuclease
MQRLRTSIIRYKNYGFLLWTVAALVFASIACANILADGTDSEIVYESTNQAADHTPPPTDSPAPIATHTQMPSEPITSSTVPPEAETALVTHIVDGDTIDVELNGMISRVRYIGINTPETNEVCGSEATVANSMLVSGKTVSMIKDVSETDQYGRLLRYVYVNDVFINAELVHLGYAEAVRYPPDTAFAELFESLAAEARAAGLGCWPSGVFDTGGSTSVTSLPSTQTPFTQQPTGEVVCNCSSNIYNCGDFTTHAEAQACFEYCISMGRGDVHRLDGDNDDLACESLP